MMKGGFCYLVFGLIFCSRGMISWAHKPVNAPARQPDTSKNG